MTIIAIIHKTTSEFTEEETEKRKNNNTNHMTKLE